MLGEVLLSLPASTPLLSFVSNGTTWIATAVQHPSKPDERIIQLKRPTESPRAIATLAGIALISGVLGYLAGRH